MRRLVSAVVAGSLLCAAAASAAAQQAPPTQEQLKERLAGKVAEAWVKDGGWVTDYDKARADAKAGGKLLFTYFTRSYSP